MSRGEKEKKSQLTAIQGVDATAQRELVSGNNAGEYSQQAAGEPPANGVSEEVNLLPRLILRPEADSAEQEGPLVRVARVGMAAGQLAVVPEHRPLQLEPLPEEGKRLHLTRRLLSALVVGGERRNVLDEPDVGARRNLLVSVDLLLAMAPVGQRLRVRPHGYLAGVVNEFKVARDTLEFLLVLSMFDADLE